MAYANIEDKRNAQNRLKNGRRLSFFSDKCCSECGRKDKLLLHHTDPSTKISGCVWAWGDVRRNAEIAKCIILCTSCHSALHNRSRERKDLVHGSSYAYKMGCRCGVCKTSNTKRVMSYRKK